jgi:hypothetical protein
VVTAEELRLKELERLCEQAERLRREAEKLCKQITARIERSRELHGSPRSERRRK